MIAKKKKNILQTNKEEINQNTKNRNRTIYIDMNTCKHLYQ